MLGAAHSHIKLIHFIDRTEALGERSQYRQ